MAGPSPFSGPRAGMAPARPPAVVTPDAVGLDLEVATVGSRGVAYVLDLLVLAGGLVLLSVAVGTFGGSGFVPASLGIALLLLLLFVWQFGYPIAFETLWGGRTLGKAAMGLRVVTIEGAPVGLRHAAIRAMTAVLELPGSLGAIAAISSFASARGQRLGDMAAGTLVVRERRAGADPTVHVFVPPAGWEAYARRLDVSGLGPAEYATVRDTLRRASQLRPEARQRVTTALAGSLAPRVSPAPPAGIAPEEWLTCVAAAVQARRAPAPNPAPNPVPNPAAGPMPAPPATSTRAAPLRVPPRVPGQDGPAPPSAERRPAADGGFAPPG